MIIVVGPTASGKSDAALALARSHNGEIVNADSVQMYTGVSVGAAKPDDWQTSDVAHHGFDICPDPIDFDVVKYRALVAGLAQDIIARGKTPILVGGSLFYVKSLFYPPAQYDVSDADYARADTLPEDTLWDELHSVDPDRANALYKQDVYRIRRALALWYATGIKPSLLTPKYEPLFENVTIVAIMPPLPVLYDRINKRTHMMIDGWGDEVAAMSNEWRSFVCKKGFIGYRSVADWVAKGRLENEKESLIVSIQQETRQYAKRQLTFWKGFSRLVNSEVLPPVVREIQSSGDIGVVTTNT
jgi:tRNA dimethylallyltransferase